MSGTRWKYDAEFKKRLVVQGGRDVGDLARDVGIPRMRSGTGGKSIGKTRNTCSQQQVICSRRTKRSDG